MKKAKRLYLGTPEGDLAIRLLYPKFVEHWNIHTQWKKLYKVWLEQGKVKYEALRGAMEQEGTIDFVSETWLK